MMKQFQIFLCICAIITTYSCKHNSKDDTILECLYDQCHQFLLSQNFDACDSTARILLEKSDSAASDHYKARALFFLGAYRYVSEKEKSKYTSILDSALALTNDHDNELKSSIYNSKGIWETRSLNYHQALAYLEKAMNFAKSAGNRDLESSAELNIAEVYRFLNDTLGFVHTKRLFDYATDKNIVPIIQNAAFHCADYLSKTSQDTIELESYTKVLREYEVTREWVDVFKCRVFINSGNIDKARNILDSLAPEMYNFIEPNILKARLLHTSGRYVESNVYADKALEMYANLHQDYNWPDLYRLKADNFNMLGMRDSTVRYLTEYVNAHDSIENMLKQEQINAYRIKYEVGTKEQELRVSKAETSKMKAIIVVGIILLLAILMFVFIYLKRQHMYFRKIVSQNKEAIRREAELIVKIEEKENVRPSISAQRSSEIFEKIMHEINDNKIWTSLTLTRDSFADLVGCNRTYFSQIIKNHTGMTFTQFMNSHRIHEAVKILSDADNKITFEHLSKECGFVSESTFYTAFKSIMGMTPATYRKMAANSEL